MELQRNACMMVYVDDSGDETCSILTAMVVPTYTWLECFNVIREWRKRLNVVHGIALRKELHAYKFVSGRGRPSPRVLTKHDRATIFADAMKTCSGLADKGVGLLNVIGGQGAHLRCCESLINRIQMFLSDFQGNAVMVFDEGNEKEYTALLRKMRVFNYVPSHWGGSYNAVANRILDDPVFRDSRQSNFIQAVDFCAYAFLRHEKPLERTNRYGIGNAFEMLDPILIKKASNSNKYGIVQV